MARYNPNATPREPIKPLRIKDEQPGGWLGALKWLRARGGIFWFTGLGGLGTIAALFIIFIPVARSQGQLDFRSPPDMTIRAEANVTTVSPGDTIVYTITHENLGGASAGAVVIDITLPDELTVINVVPGTPACSQATELERFSSTGLGDITGEPGGVMRCLFGTRSGGATGSVVLEASVGAAISGTALKTAFSVTTEQTRGLKKPETFLDNNNADVTVTVR